MKKDYTHVSILLDRSGSMKEIKEAVIGGFNEYINKQKMVPGTMTVSLIQFDDEYEVLHDFTDLNNIQPLTKEIYAPRSMTRLLDSTAKLITDTGIRIASMQEDDRPDRVIFTVITDGMENNSQEYGGNFKAIATMIKHQGEKYNWQFVYIGTDHDIFGQADGMGIRKNVVNFQKNAQGTRSAFAAFSGSNVKYRTGASGQSLDLTQEDVDNENK